jgi:acetyltransferase-like isoleucine patch superfamily enzyme
MFHKPIISPNIRLRCPEAFEVGEGSIVDDFCYISARVKIGRFSHVASGCTIAGGKTHRFTLGDYCSLSAGVRIWCGSDDFTRDLVAIMPEGFPPIKENLILGDVTFESLTAVGSNSVVMPGVFVPQGTVIGAMSFVPPHVRLEPWMVYAGVPARPVKPRDRSSVMRQREVLERYLAEETRR